MLQSEDTRVGPCDPKSPIWCWFGFSVLCRHWVQVKEGSHRDRRTNVCVEKVKKINSEERSVCSTEEMIDKVICAKHCVCVCVFSPVLATY